MSRLLIILTLIVLTSCGQSTQSDHSENQLDKNEITTTKIESAQTDNDPESEKKSKSFECTDFDFNSTTEQSDSLLAFMERAANSDSIDRQKWVQNFFCAFPNSFDRMQAIFGYDNEKGAAPLYYKGANVIQYFNQLQSISDSLYYDKFVKININGIWEADNIQSAFGFDTKLLNDTENVCKSLSNFTDQEIKSVFRFIFDGPHPDNESNENLYKNLKSKIDSQNKRLSRLLTLAYKNLMAENDGHGH